MKSLFVNVSAVDLGKKHPGEEFKLAVFEDGQPVDLYWRKRVKDGSVKRKDETKPTADVAVKSKGK
jgi:hypothetical protein